MGRFLDEALAPLRRQPRRKRQSVFGFDWFHPADSLTALLGTPASGAATLKDCLDVIKNVGPLIEGLGPQFDAIMPAWAASLGWTPAVARPGGGFTQAAPQPPEIARFYRALAKLQADWRAGLNAALTRGGITLPAESTAAAYATIVRLPNLDTALANDVYVMLTNTAQDYATLGGVVDAKGTELAAAAGAR